MSNNVSWLLPRRQVYCYVTRRVKAAWQRKVYCYNTAGTDSMAGEGELLCNTAGTGSMAEDATVASDGIKGGGMADSGNSTNDAMLVSGNVADDVPAESATKEHAAMAGVVNMLADGAVVSCNTEGAWKTGSCSMEGVAVARSVTSAIFLDRAWLGRCVRCIWDGLRVEGIHSYCSETA